MPNARNQYPEINAMTLLDCDHALNLADLNRANLKPEALAECDSRVRAIRERRRRLEATHRQITATQRGGK